MHRFRVTIPNPLWLVTEASTPCLEKLHLESWVQIPKVCLLSRCRGAGGCLLVPGRIGLHGSRWGEWVVYLSWGRWRRLWMGK